jgi:tetraacyldisaccharide 4'-kinase
VQSFPAHWLRVTPLSVVLLPVSWLFAAATAARRALYRAGLLETRRVPVPVIVVGNLVVGGAGKTPLVLDLVARLIEAGHNPGIVSRGYGGTARGTAKEATPVHAQSDPAVHGDEPVLLAQRSGAPVWIGRDRAQAAAMLLRAHPECDVIVSDDGLQHYRLARDIEIAVEDDRGHGNGLLLPAGPLREAAGRRVDALVINGEIGARRRAPIESGGGPVFRMTLEPDGFYGLHDRKRPVPKEDLAGKRLHAVAGIGNPERFFRLLDDMGLRAHEHTFPDHHRFSASDLEFSDCDAVLMTEKDAVKCERFARGDLYALRVRAKLDPSFHEFVLTRLRRAHDGRAAA